MNKNFTLSSADFSDILNHRFSSGTDVQLVVTGNSMLPFLADKRDKVILSPFSGKANKGDILFYRRIDGRCVLHRVVKTDEKGIDFLGDSQTAVEGPLSYDQVLAECNEVIRKGRRITRKSFVWLFFSHIWLNIIPLRQPIIKFIGKIKNSHK